MHKPGSTVLITGASSGIGKVTALLLAEQGYDVFGTSRSEDRLAALRDEAERRGVDIKGVVLDINDEAAVDSAMPRLLDDAGGAFDVLVNNAGYGSVGASTEPCDGRTEGTVRDQLLRRVQAD